MAEFAEIKHVSRMSDDEIEYSSNEMSRVIRMYFKEGRTGEGCKVLIDLEIISLMERVAQTFEEARGHEFKFNLDQCRFFMARRRAFEMLHKLSAKIMTNPLIATMHGSYTESGSQKLFAEQTYNDLSAFSMWLVYCGGTQQQRNEYMDYKHRRALEKRRGSTDTWFSLLFVSMSAMLSMCDRIFEPTIERAEAAAKAAAEKKRLEKLRKKLFKPLARRFDGWEDAKAYEPIDEPENENYEDSGFKNNAFELIAR